MKIYAMYTQLRSWDAVGEVFSSAEERTASLRSFTEEIEEDVPEEADDDELSEICSSHGHDIHLFEGEIEVPCENAEPLALIHGLIDGQQWNADKTAALIEILAAAGLPVRDPEESASQDARCQKCGSTAGPHVPRHSADAFCVDCGELWGDEDDEEATEVGNA